MKKMTIEATVPAKDDQPQVGPYSLEVDYAENLEEAKQMYGEEAILTNAFANWRVTLQGNMRAGMKKGETQEQLQARLGGAIMGTTNTGAKVDPVQAYLAKFASATPEQQKEMLAELQARAAAV